MKPSRRFLTLSAAVLVGSVMAACGSSSSPDGASSPPAVSPSASTLDGTRMQSALDAWIESTGLVGATAAVVTPDGTWAGAAGMDGTGAALVPTSALPIASVTKTVTGAEVMLLAQQGKIDLDAPVTTYVDVPWDTRGATVRELLGMRSGFPGLEDAVLLPKVAADLSQRWTNKQLVALVDPSGPRIGTRGAPTTGDMSTWYNSVNFDLLAMVIEKVTGTTTAAAIRRDLLEPLALERIWWQPEEKPTAPLAAALDDPARKLSDPASGYLPSTAWGSAMGGGGCMAADAPTLAAWGAALYGARAVPQSVVDQMAGASPDGYGLATARAVLDDGSLLLGHLGDARIAGSLLFHWPATGVTVAVLVPQGLGDEPPTLAFAESLAALALLAT